VFTRIAILLCIALPCLGQAANSDAEDALRHPRTVYFTVGDYQDLLYTPLDSEASITAAFDVMHKLYNVKRVWWRGGQDEVWGKQFVIREQSRRYKRLWDWWMDAQYRVVNTNHIAVKAGHARGMEVWMAYGLFDNGSPADVGFGGFPYAAEDRIRAEHPEWAPVNKYGTWRQGGPIEFAYPEARKAMVDYLAKHVIEGGYDGIAFLTYVENYSMRYEDEFGYSQPIVDEFRKRHGVDIRTEKFDRNAWAKLRGEHLTQFMRELHTALGKHGKKIAISPDGKQPNLPCLWNVEGGVRTVGRLWMDIEAWASEGIVDEISPYYPNTEESLAAVRKICEGTNVSVSAWGRTGGALPEGFGRIMTIGNELESGFDWSHRIDFPTEVVPTQPESAFTSDDVYARRKILTAVAKGKQKAQASDVIPLLKDPDVYVRRGALRALSKIGDTSAVPAIEEALKDPENSVRWLAAVTLGELHSPNCVKVIFGATALDNSTYQFNFVAVPEVLRQLKKDERLSDTDIQLLLDLTRNPIDRVRETAWYSIKLLALHPPAMEIAVLRTLKEDSNPYCRELALSAMCNLPPAPKLFDAIIDAMRNDKDEVVQDRACMTLAGLTRSAGAPKEILERSVGELTRFFRSFGEGCQRNDKSWGWRECGNALRALGKPGEAALVGIMGDSKDRQLADLAWRVLYLKQEDKFCFVTEEEDRLAHERHPFLTFSVGAAGK
jgi:hypothetical protein